MRKWHWEKESTYRRLFVRYNSWNVTSISYFDTNAYDPQKQEHIPYKCNSSKIGTINFIAPTPFNTC